MTRSTWTHCLHGHEFTEQNTYLTPEGRECLACKRRRQREYVQRKRVQT